MGRVIAKTFSKKRGLTLKIFILLLVYSVLSATVATAADLQAERELAITIIKEAIANETDRRLILSYARVSAVMSELFIEVPSQQNKFAVCDHSTLAFFIPKVRNTIFVCDRLLTKTSAAIAQTLIHEAIHAAGITDECETTELELSIMRTSGRGESYQNSYIESCGLKIFS